MGYYVRVLSTSSEPIPVSRLRIALEETGSGAALEIEAGTPEGWSQIVLSHSGGDPIASIERGPVVEGKIGEEEIAEFRAEVRRARPRSAAAWLLNYLDRVRCVYAFQVLRGADAEGGWEALDAVKECVWRSAPAVLQADAEGFTNEEGFHILWQFGTSVRGEWWMAVLEDGRWRRFQMDLGDRAHRRAFKEGRVPDGVVEEPE